MIEAMWLFTGRYNPSLLWNINLQRTQNGMANPISRLTGGDVELCGVENGVRHSLKFCFERTDGIVRSADDNPDGALESFCNHLRNANPTPPGRHADFLSGEPAVGIFIMCDGIQPGALETLLKVPAPVSA